MFSTNIFINILSTKFLAQNVTSFFLSPTCWHFEACQRFFEILPINHSKFLTHKICYSSATISKYCECNINTHIWKGAVWTKHIKNWNSNKKKTHPIDYSVNIEVQRSGTHTHTLSRWSNNSFGNCSTKIKFIRWIGLNGFCLASQSPTLLEFNTLLPWNKNMIARVSQPTINMNDMKFPEAGFCTKQTFRSTVNQTKSALSIGHVMGFCFVVGLWFTAKCSTLHLLKVFQSILAYIFSSSHILYTCIYGRSYGSYCLIGDNFEIYTPRFYLFSSKGKNS